MPIDGVSFSNSGFNITNPQEVNILAESAAIKEAEKKIKEAEKSDKTEADPNEEEENTERNLEGRYSGENDEQQDEDAQNKNLIEKKKKFEVKFNSTSEMVELIDLTTGEVLETVTPDDLLKLLSKSKSFSGVFVDRKI